MSPTILIEIIKILPSLVWSFIVIGLIIIFYRPIKDELIPRMTGLKALGFEATFIKKELDRLAESKPAGTEASRDQVARRAQRIKKIIEDGRILFVNDSPDQMQQVISILKSLGMSVDIATSTSQALILMTASAYDVVISDMKRGDIVDEGLRFLNETIKRGIMQPMIFTVGHYEPDRGVPPFAFGITNRVDELFNLIFDVLERARG
jgi:CheY-like chemotaxis protein